MGLNRLIFMMMLMLMGLSPFLASAQPERATAYALIVGSNRPGEGQQALKYALEDADRFRSVLLEIGGFTDDRIALLEDPDSDAVRSAFRTVSEQLAAHRDQGEEAIFVFYYSGHARARSLNLGTDELPLLEMRDLLDSLSAKVKLVVLDACQTGAISNIKGAEPVADFSYNSTNRLNTSGTIVMASSAASELSQESPDLMGSFFTHHLVAGLRGAADRDKDGRVTLFEAYHYAYNRTLVATAKTAVGKQHVTLETALQGKGEMVLTWPSDARAWLELPQEMQAEVLVHTTPGQVVVAEIHKASGDQLRLALAPAAYGAFVRDNDKTVHCDIDLTSNQRMALVENSCTPVEAHTGVAKGQDRRKRGTERVAFELATGALFEQEDTYNDRLTYFSYRKDIDEVYLKNGGFYFALAAYGTLLRYLQVGLAFSTLDDALYQWPDHSASSDDSKTFEWRAYRWTLNVRGRYPLFGGWLIPYVQAGGGLSLGKTDFNDTSDQAGGEYSESYVGYAITGGGGLQAMPWSFLGFFVQVEHIWAPAIENLVGDTHDSGGLTIALGVRGGG